MSFVDNVKISKKIPVLIALTALLSCGLIAGVAIYDARNELRSAYKEKLFALAHSRQTMLDNYLKGIAEDVETLAGNKNTQAAIEEYTLAWNEMANGQKENLQSLYIQNNPNAIGEKHKLDAAEDGSLYSQTHKAYHPWFREFLEARGYYDIFLFDTNGNVIYTVFKELDFASNVLNGDWKDTDLGKVYRDAMALNETGKFVFADFKPYAPSANVPASFIATPVFKDGRKIGVLAFQMPIGRINAIMNEVEGMGKTGETYVVGEDYLMRSQSRFVDEKTEGTTILKSKVQTPATEDGLAGEGKDGFYIGKNYKGVDSFTAYHITNFGGKKFLIVGEQDEAEAMAPADSMMYQIIGISAAITLAIAVLGYLLSLGVTRPLARMNQIIKSLAEGNRNIAVTDTEREDEIGDIAKSALVFKENLEAKIQMEENQKQQEEQSRLDRKKAMMDLAANFESRMQNIVESVAAASTELTHTAELMTKEVTQSSHSSQDASAAVNQTSSNVQSVAASLEEMTASVQEISSQITRSNVIINDTAMRTNQADEYAKALMLSTDKVKNVIDLISEIASQIGLLALNATIESARAGEAGKGFAVVASEVKNLSVQTNKSIDEIRAVIEEMLAASTQISGAIASVASSVKEVTQNSTVIASAVEEQSATTGEISRNMQVVSQATSGITSNLNDVSSTSQRAASSSNEVLVAASELSQQAEELDKQMKIFLQEIRAA